VAAQIVSSWFRTHPAELKTILLPAKAHESCRRLLAG
jgi:hypothetical protein